MNANKPIPMPEYLPYWALTQQRGNTFMFIYSSDVNCQGLFRSEEAAQHQKLIELLRNPDAKYYVHRLLIPTTYTAE